MDTLLRLLPLLKILLVLAAMLAGIRLRLGIAASILGGSVLLALVFRLGPAGWLTTAVGSLTDGVTLCLAAIVGLILVFADLYEKSGQSQSLLDALAGFLRKPRLRLIFFTVLIGLLPMPGGAVFSAPMVQSAAEGLPVKAEDKALLNYWFRHSWEVSWPLYPGLILAASLSGIPLPTLSLFMAPAIVLFLLLGWAFFLRPGVLPLPETPALERPATNDFRRAMRCGAPLAVAIGGAVLLEAAMGVFLPGAPFEWGVIAALAAAIALAASRCDEPRRIIARVVLAKSFWNMIFLVAAVFVFKDVLAGSGAVEGLSQVAGGEAALAASASLLPFVVGLVAGINMAFVGASLPLVMGLLGALGLQDQKVAWVVLAGFMGFCGVMASPVHICFILTCQFFGADLARTWKRLVPPVGLLALGGVSYFLLLV